VPARYPTLTGEKRPTALVVAALALLALAGCRQDMHDQPRYEPLEASDLFGDRRASRPLVDGTVARGELREDALLYTGKVDGKDAEEFPFPLTEAVLARGRERYDIFCAPCHGRTGEGDGMIVQRGYRRPTSYHALTLQNAPVGHFFDVITNGWGAMPDYASQIEVRDRWAIAAYIRALQATRVNVGELTIDQLEKLKEQGK